MGERCHAIPYIASPATDALRHHAPYDTPYGSREYSCRDPEGHIWCFGTYRGEPGAG